MAGAGGTGKGGLQRDGGGGAGSGLKGPGLWALCRGVRVGDSARTGISLPRDSKGTLQLHYLPLELCWLLGKWSVF